MGPNHCLLAQGHRSKTSSALEVHDARMRVDVLLVLIVAGGVVALVGVLLSARRAVRLRWTEQRTWELTDLSASFKAAMGDAEAAATVQANREQFRREMGHYPEDEPRPDRQQIWREELGWPVVVAVIGIVMVTVAGVLSLLIK